MSQPRGPLFYFFQSIVRFFSYLNYCYHEMVRNLFPTQWIRAGKCLSCGSCCDFPTIVRARIYFRFKTALNFIITWHEYWYGFQFHELRPEHKQIVFTCTHLKNDRTCADYAHRPLMCRNYPEIKTWFGRPDFFEHCGYKSIRKIDLEVQKHVAEFQQRAQHILSANKENTGKDENTTSSGDP